MEAAGIIGQSFAASGPDTRGAIITVAGKKVKLPDDAYIKHFIVEILCAPGQKCLQAPVYVVGRGNSEIAFSARTGEIGQEKVAAGEQGTFDFLKRALQ